MKQKGFFTNKDGTKSTDEKPMSNTAKDLKKKYGDVVLPKRPSSGYICFTTHNLNRVKEEEKIAIHTQAMVRCGAIWNAMTPAEKKKYEDMHDKDVKRYEKQLKELEKKGYFMMDDGSKSSDHTPKVKRNAAKNDPQDDVAEKIKPKKKFDLQNSNIDKDQKVPKKKKEKVESTAPFTNEF